MNKELFLLKAEQILNEKLDKNLFSFRLDNSFNDFNTFIYIKSIKSGNVIQIGCSYYENKINFWNSFDEEFVQPLTEEGLLEILKKAFSEKSVEYTYSFFYDGWAQYSVGAKMDKPENNEILDKLSEILKESKIKYEHIIFSDFFGEISKKIIFNDKTQRFEIV